MARPIPSKMTKSTVLHSFANSELILDKSFGMKRKKLPKHGDELPVPIIFNERFFQAFSRVTSIWQSLSINPKSSRAYYEYQLELLLYH